MRGQLATVPFLAPQDIFALALAIYNTEKHPTPKRRGGEYGTLSLQLGSCHSKEVRRGRQISGEGLRFNGENVHHPHPAT
jgi:hypothetical protein